MSKLVGERLASERERVKLKRLDFGVLGGVKEQAQGRYERGERAPDTDYLEELHKGGVDVNYVITGQRVSGDTNSGYTIQRYQLASEALEPVLAVQAKLNLLFSAEQIKTLLEYTYTYQLREEELSNFVESAYTLAGVDMPHTNVN
ncbi:MAG: helix-turn-helix transcriptional regulator [Porticoccaceae bacterium]|nr:helix-turn-helix transcriptional regulator [Porticoccaceae bacterium]